MSLLFDSLRRGRQSRRPAAPDRTARGDAVLSELAYAPARLPAPEVTPGRVALALGLAGIAGLAWIVHETSGLPAVPSTPVARAAAPAADTPDSSILRASPPAMPRLATLPPRTHFAAPSSGGAPEAVAAVDELNAQAHNNLGVLYQEKNLLDDSARELKRALVIDPRYAAAHNNYGVTLLRKGNPGGAAAEFRTALTLQPGNVDALVNLALAENASGRRDRAVTALLDALTIGPHSAAAHYNLGVLYDDANDASRAVEHYRAFLDDAGSEYADRAADVKARLAVLIGK